MAISTTIGTPAPGSDPTVIANRITVEIVNPETNTVLAVGVGMSAAEVTASLQDTSNSRQRLIAESERLLRDSRNALADLNPNAGSEALYQKRKASLEQEISNYESRIAKANLDIAAANEAKAYVSSGGYQSAIDQRVSEATQPAPVATATPDSAAGNSGNSENPAPAEATTSPVPNPDITSSQTSVNEEAAYAEAQRKAAAAEEETKAAIASSKTFASDPSATRLATAGVSAGAAPPSKNPTAPSVSVSGVKKEDLRVRIALAPQSPNIFYNDPKNDLLKPLQETQGVIFPIQPTITIGHEARYQGTDLTHSNFTFWNYQNSAVKPISLTGDFLIRNPKEGRYCIAAIRFLQAMTKMFNANDTANNMKGAPPAVARLYGLGLMGFDSIPVAITSVDVTYGSDSDLLSLAVAIDGSTEVTKLPAQFQITVSMNPIFSREFATNFFGTQDYASGKVRLLGKQVIKPIKTPEVPAVAGAPAPGNSNVKTSSSSTTAGEDNMAKPDSAVGNSGGSGLKTRSVTPVSNPGTGTDSSYEESTEKTSVTNADGSKTEVETKTVNGVKTTTTTNTDRDGKVTTTIDGGASGTGADSASTKAGATGNGGDSTQPTDETPNASTIDAKAQITADFVAQRDQIIAQVQSGYDAIKQAITDYSATYLAMLNRNQATSQADLATDQTELAAVQNGTMTFPTPGGFTSIAEIQQSIASEQKAIASRQAKIDAGAPYYGLTQDQFNLAASTEPSYLSAKKSASDALNALGNLTATRQSAVDFDALPSFSASWYAVPPEITINSKKLT